MNNESHIHVNRLSSSDAAQPHPALSIIAAMARNHTIGLDNDLPWRLPEDLKHFKSTTAGKPVIMGRKTFQSLSEPLPGRYNIVVSATLGAAKGVEVVASLEEAIDKATLECGRTAAREYFVVGGAALYKDSLPRAQRMYLTLVHADVTGDTFFPEFDWSVWQESARQDFAKSPSRTHAFSIVTYQRKVAV